MATGSHNRADKQGHVLGMGHIQNLMYCTPTANLCSVDVKHMCSHNSLSALASQALLMGSDPSQCVYKVSHE